MPMTMAEMLKAGKSPNGIMLNAGSVDGVGGGMNPLISGKGSSTVGGGVYVPFGDAGSSDPATRLSSIVGEQQSPTSGNPYTFTSHDQYGAPKTVTMRGDLNQPVGSYGGTPAAGSSKANWLAGIGTGSAPVAPTPNAASGGLAGQQQQTSYLRKLAEIVKAPKRQSIGETNTSDIPQQ